MNNQEYYDYEDRRYVSPTTSRDEQLNFANNLRSVANNDIAKIKNDTYNLGTHVPSNLGGLTGSTGLWNRNFVSPKVESMVQGLRAVSQSSALENAMNNYLNQKKQQYQNAYKAAAKRAASRGGSGGGGGGYTTTGGGSGSDLIALLDWMAQNGYDVDTENAGTPTTEDTLTKGNYNISTDDMKSAANIVANQIPWSAVGTAAGSAFGPMGSAVGAVWGAGKDLGWWGK